MSAIIDMRTRQIRALDAKAQPEESVTEADIPDVPKMARLLTRILREIADLKRRFAPRVITYVNLDVDNTGTTVYRLAHQFGGPVAWWPVGWTPTTAGTGASLEQNALTNKNTLALVSNEAGVVAIRVEELG